MPAQADLLDLGTLGLATGEARRLQLTLTISPLTLAGETYGTDETTVDVVVDVSRMTGHGYSLRLRFTAGLAGPCMRCLDPAAPAVTVDAREVDRPGEGEELDSPYVDGDVLDLGAWARDAFALAAPDRVLCRPSCRGLCPECATNLNRAAPDHHHDKPPDPRWAKLRDLRLD